MDDVQKTWEVIIEWVRKTSGITQVTDDWDRQCWKDSGITCENSC